eukprot:gnl/Carplike_NY0171/1259_a1701_793.p1 GENE.gnl/Carplike_NY0171/1259_a1701_793~~gnl/Carplike_NY0171/1259_a1701_793.p1  ORF type:complete len:547 (-),score=120.17 gnl/Carplike_NY0171/1259_a1701_793:101-1741(-)
MFLSQSFKNISTCVILLNFLFFSALIISLAYCSSIDEGITFDYGYDGYIDELREKEMPHLNNETYLDYTGSGLYTQAQIDAFYSLLQSNLYCNAHSRAPCSIRTEKEVNEARDLILSFFNTSSSEYSVVFTSGATQGLKMIGEYFPWTEESAFVYTTHNHNSVLGMRKYAKRAGGIFKAFEQSELEEILSEYQDSVQINTEEVDPFGGDFGGFSGFSGNTWTWGDKGENPAHLFAFPAECNFSGIKYPLDWINEIKRGDMGAALNAKLAQYDGIDRSDGEWFVALDAAAFVPTNRLDLSLTPADFVVMSFYKMFGFPTGLGALLVRHDVAERLQKPYFGGGSVSIVGCREDFCQEKPRPSDRLEDGTVGFLNIIALKEGFKLINETLGGIENIEQHVSAVTQYAFERLSSLKHENGNNVVEIYGNHEKQWINGEYGVQGGILSLSVHRPDGSFVGYYTVQEKSAQHRIHLRTGMVCNPGACYSLLGLDETLVCEMAAEKESCGDDIDMVNGMPLGSVRVSFGFASTKNDVDRLVEFIRQEFMEESS